MNDINMLEAFGRYKVKPMKYARSVLTQNRELVLSCAYTRFRRAEAGVLRYEEELSAETGADIPGLREHLTEALERELEVMLVISTTVERRPTPDIVVVSPERPARVSFYARRDLVGRVTFFDGQRFVVEFRKGSAPAERHKRR